VSLWPAVVYSFSVCDAEGSDFLLCDPQEKAADLLG